MADVTVRKLVTEWILKADAKAVEHFNKAVERTKKTVEETGKAIDNTSKKTERRNNFKPPVFGPRRRLDMQAATFTKIGKDKLPFVPNLPKVIEKPTDWAKERKAAINSVSDAANKATSIFAKMAGAFAVGSLGVGMFFGLVGSMEQTEIAFETMIGDAEKARKTLEELKVFAKNTPFNFAQTADLSKQLLAFSFAAEDLIPTMTALGNIAAGVGREKLPQLVLALGQVKAAGKLRGSELRQFTEAGVPLIAELSKTLNIAESEVQSMVETGTVGFDKVWASLQRVTGEGGRFNNLMARQSKSLLGMFSNLVDELQLMAVDLGNTGLLGKAKQFLGSIITYINANREGIINTAREAIELTLTALEKLIAIGRGAWNVFKGLANVLGGTRKALDMLIKGLFIITSARLIFLLGTTVQGIWKMAAAWRGAGTAAMWAQIKMAAIPLAIGATVVALALILEDIVGYFQGRKSITGIILKDLDNIGDKFEKFVGPILERIKNFAKNVGKWLVEGLAALTDGDWGAIGNGLLKALEIVGLLTTIPLRIGAAIAQGLISGIFDGIREKYPKLASFLEIEKKEPILPPPGTKIDFAKDLSVTGGIYELSRLLWRVWQSGPNKIGEMKGPSWSTIEGRPGYVGDMLGGGVKIDAPITVTVPPGTSPDMVGPALESGIQKGIERTLREGSRAVKPATEY